MNDDFTLREHFASLRRADEARAPGFDEVLRHARREPSRGWRGLTVAASALLAAVSVVIVRGSRLHAPPTILSTALMRADWRGPTDFLLDTPGRELLHSIPRLGRPALNEFGPFPSTRTTTQAPGAGRERS